MTSCAVIDCQNTGIHPFPKDVERRKLWVKALRRTKWRANNSSRLCAIHFKPEDYFEKNSYTGDDNIRKVLRKTAVPSLFLNPSKFVLAFTSKLQDADISRTPPKKNNIKNNEVSPQNTEKKEEDSSETNNVLRNRSVRLKNRKAYLLNRRCSVPHCNSRPSNEISLHPCPNNAAVRNEWAEALGVSYQYVKNMVACSLHFSKIHFVQSSNSERVLKYNAVPCRNLPNRKVTVPVKHKPKKYAANKAFEKQQMMTDTIDETKEAIQDAVAVARECRGCLKRLDYKKSFCNVFQAWAPPWEGMEATIAEDLGKLANVEITPTDRHSKVLCAPCYQKLLEAATFVNSVRNCDLLLRMRFTAEIDMEKVWPKPIQVDKNINSSVFTNPMDVDIKEEVVSDDEYHVNGNDNPYLETELSSLDIKIEPEELVEPPPMNITINGTISLDPLNSENNDLKNGTEVQQESQYIEMEVKQEPTSEGEQEIDLTPDVPLECLLCTKSFNSVTGLKAHVIAQHSYKTVKRKADGSMSPEKKRCDQHKCKICKRSFQTSTDLMVHETCHNKHACYGCTEKFDSFELLTRHRKRCKASIGNPVKKLKTLEDVKRPLPEEKVDHLDLLKEQIVSNNTIKEDEDIEMKESKTLKTEDVEMKDLNSEQKEEESKRNQVENDRENAENIKNQLENVNEKADHDQKSESVKEKVDHEQLQSVLKEDTNNKQLLSITGEDENNKHLLSVTEEDENDKQLQSVTEEDENNKKILSVIEEDETNKHLLSEIEEDEKNTQLLSVIEADDNNKQLLSGIEEDENNKELLSGIEEDEKNKQLISVTEEVEDNKQLLNVIEEDEDNNQLLNLLEDNENNKQQLSEMEDDENNKQLLNVIEEVENYTKPESVFEAVDIKLENIIEEEDSDTIKIESEVDTEATNIESENKEMEDHDSMNLHLEIHSTKNETESILNDADMPVETLDNDDCI